MQVHSAAMASESRFENQPSRCLVSTAHEFEGQMLKELLKPLTKSGGLDASDSGSEILGEFGSEALGKALSEQGGFGIAKQIITQLSRSGNQTESAPVTGNRHFDTGISGRK